MTLPTTAGTYTYTFSGKNSGRSAQAMITVTGATNGNGNGSTQSGTAAIDQNGQSYHVGSSIDFGGHNFGHEEPVTVTLNGQQVGSAHADGSGNFSTGSILLPTAAGTYTYTFSGKNSSQTAQATIYVQ